MFQVPNAFSLTLQPMGLEMLPVAPFIGTLLWLSVHTWLYFGQSDFDSHLSPPAPSLPFFSRFLNSHWFYEQGSRSLLIFRYATNRRRVHTRR